MDRLLVFPEPFPDESLYSLAVRYHRTVANDSYRLTSHELFGTYSRTCGSVLPCCLGALSQRLGGMYSVRELVESRTLLPLYVPFLEDAAYASAIRCMEGYQGTGLMMSLGITASGLLKHASFRYCESCVQYDTQHYGVPYWHRIHMAAGVCTCPHHGKVLLSASFPCNADWRCMLLPGEPTATPVLNDYALEAVNAVAEMQFWGLENPSCVSDLLRNRFFMWRLTEMGMLQQGRLREQAIKVYVERRFMHCTKEAEFRSVTGDSEWVLRLLRRRGRIIQPFRFYFLCWILESTLDDLRGFELNTRCHEGFFGLPTRRRKKSASEEEIAARRLVFINDCNEKFHDKVGYYWLFHHDHEWLQSYISSRRIVSVRESRVDWSARDANLSLELLAARETLMSLKGKPIKVTKSALVRQVSNDHGFLKNPTKLPESSKVISNLLETEHDYQVRKIIWAIKNTPYPKYNFTTVLLRIAGIRVRRVSDCEIRKLVEGNNHY